jgi:8-oxo-dGTP pyrophosphatase MutT (NUDIX family)
MSIEPTKDLPESLASRRPAAVLLLVRPIGPRREPHLIFMRRSEKVHTHKGQISFPGGSFQPEDGTLEGTALRETFEELGIPPERMRVLGPLPPVDTVVSNFLIRPFVAVPTDPAAPLEYISDGFEVAEILEIPLKLLLDPANRRYEEWVMQGRPRQVVFFNFQQVVIWGATAFILTNFINEINSGKWPMLFS